MSDGAKRQPQVRSDMADALGVPIPVMDVDVDVDDQFNFDDGTYWYDDVRIDVEAGDRTKVIAWSTTEDFRTVCWTATAWCRAFGVPGVWKEQLTVKVPDRVERYRLGGLYMYMDVPLTERETDYKEYGENPAHAQDILTLLDDS